MFDLGKPHDDVGHLGADGSAVKAETGSNVVKIGDTDLTVIDCAATIYPAADVLSVEAFTTLGLLRAVGMTRAQIRSSVRWEAVIIAMFGTGLALVVEAP